ncbi:MAG: sulfite exporter TauE/SafE family protein [Paracoccaceae bacterium]
MTNVMTILPMDLLLLAMGIACLSGIVKGIVGFAMPMVLISGLSSFVAPDLALVGLILPTLVTNAMQALRQGRSEAHQSVMRFRYFLLAGAVMMMLSAQFVTVLRVEALLLMIAVPVVAFAATQLLGWRIPLTSRQTVRADLSMGAFAGAVGGVSGIWGPQTVTYLTAIGTPKQDAMRIQGVIYGLGACLLVVAHMASGLFTWATAPFSALLVPPAVLGMWIGGQVQDRFDQATFRKITLCVLLIGGLNLIRRAVM